MENIVEEVEEENVVQVVTNNATNFKVVDQMLMEKRKILFQTPCATHCVDLILEDYEKKVLTKEKTIPKGRRIKNLYLFQNFSHFSTITLHH